MHGRTALVVGAASGMGSAIAVELARAGAIVAACDIDLGGAEATADSIGAPALALRLDVTDVAAISGVVESAGAALGNRPTILVYTAGILHRTSFADISHAEFSHSLAVNLEGAFHCAQAVLPAMRQVGWGRMVMLSSTAGKTVSTLGGVHYTVAKTGLLGLTRAIAAEVAADGVTVNAVCPGLIETPMITRVASADELAHHAGTIPAGRLGTPQEVARLVAYLCSEDASYITGAAIDINGGDLMV